MHALRRRSKLAVFAIQPREYIMQGKIALEEHFAPPADWDNRLKYVSARLPNWPEFARRQEQTFDLGLKEMD